MDWSDDLDSQEVLIVVVILVLLFGAKRLPELARSLGKSMNEFKKGRQEDSTDTANGGEQDESPKT